MKPRQLLATAAILAATGAALVLFGLDHGSVTSRGVRVLGPLSSRRAVVSLFRRADALEVYTYEWPDDLRKPHVLGVLRRQDDPKRWEAWTRDVDHARRWSSERCTVRVHVRFLARGKELAVGNCIPSVSQITVFLTPRKVAHVEFESSLHGLLTRYEEQVSNETRRWIADFRKRQGQSEPQATERAGLRSVAQPPASNFDETQARLVKLFRECSYINLSPSGGGVSVATEGRAAWHQMTRAVEQADQGWAIPGEAEVTIAAMVIRPGETVRPVELGYAGGQLGCGDSYYGGNIHTLRPGKGFREGLQALQVLAQEGELRDQATRHEQSGKETR